MTDDTNDITNDIEQALQDLIEDGRVEEVEDGQYKLTPDGIQHTKEMIAHDPHAGLFYYQLGWDDAINRFREEHESPAQLVLDLIRFDQETQEDFDGDAKVDLVDFLELHTDQTDNMDSFVEDEE
jgi:Mn-dependent DtxR family transcriptional regulator